MNCCQSSLDSNTLEGLKIFEREIRMTQLADDTVLFLKHKQQITSALKMIDIFSAASGLKLNLKKCEILSLHNTEETCICEIPIKSCAKYLGIYLSKNHNEHQIKNFRPKIQKTKNIFNMWLQRDLSLLGRVLLSKVDGISRFVYSTLSLFVKQSLCKEINNV